MNEAELARIERRIRENTALMTALIWQIAHHRPCLGLPEWCPDCRTWHPHIVPDLGYDDDGYY